MADDLDLGATLRGYRAGQKVFGRYVLQKILGRGGMGVVWLARDEQLERDVALKFLPEILAMDKEAVRDLKRETRRSLELTHSHIVRIYDFVQDAGAAAISMEYIAGDTLAARKAEDPRGHFEVRELREWVRQLGEALTYAHEKAEVVHRDLKPANLMIDARGDLRVADFGIAASVSDSVSRVSVQAGSSGTPVYMSPQQMMGDKPAVSDDVYAMGATLFDLLTGKPPFYRGNVVMQVQGKAAPTIAERRAELGVKGEAIPPHWEETLAACLAKDAGERPASVAELTRRLLHEASPGPVRGEDMTLRLAFTAEDLRLGGTFEFTHQPGLFRLTKRVVVPAGTMLGQVLRLRGEGRAGSDGGEAGDLLITVEEKRPDETVTPTPPPLPDGTASALTVPDIFRSGMALTGSLVLLAGLVLGLVVTWLDETVEAWRWLEYPAWMIWLGLSFALVHRAARGGWPGWRRLAGAGLWGLGGLVWLEATYWYFEYAPFANGEMVWPVNVAGAAALLVWGRLGSRDGWGRGWSIVRRVVLGFNEVSDAVARAILLGTVVTYWPLPGSMEGVRAMIAVWMVAGGAAWLTLWRYAEVHAVARAGNEARDWRLLWLIWTVLMSGLLSVGLMWFWMVGNVHHAWGWAAHSWVVEGGVLVFWLGLLLGLAAKGHGSLATGWAWLGWGAVAVVGWAGTRTYLLTVEFEQLAAPERFLQVVPVTLALGLLLAGLGRVIIARGTGGVKRTVSLVRAGLLGGLLGALAVMGRVPMSWEIRYHAPIVMSVGAVIITVLISLVYSLPREPSGRKH